MHLLTHLPLSALVGLRALQRIVWQVVYALLRRLRANHAPSLPSRRDMAETLRLTLVRSRRVLRSWRGSALRSARARPLRALTVASLLVILLASCLGSIVTLLPHFAAAQTTFTPNTYSHFSSTGNALAKAPGAFTTIAPSGPAQDGGTPPDKAPASSGTPLTHPVRVALDAQHLYNGSDAVGDPKAAVPVTSSEGILAVQVADHAVDISAASVPGAGFLGSSVSAAQDGPLTLELKPTTGTFRGQSMSLVGFALHVVDAQGREAQGVTLHAPLLLTFHYHPHELAGLNTADLRLVWPATADQQHNQAAAWVPVGVNPQSATLTASVSTLQSGPMVLSGLPSDASPASSEHLQMTGNSGDVTFTVPFDVPPAAGGLAPNLQLVYSSGGPNGRYARNAPAPWTGDGWDLSLGSISYDGSSGLYYLNGIGGDSEVLLCCHNTGTNGINYFVPHHHADVRIFTTDNSSQPNTTGSCFVVRTPDGLEYDLGCTADSLRSTVTNGAKTYYEWDVNSVRRLYDNGTPNGGFLQAYFVSYWQDTATSGGISYTRDAAPREIDYNYAGSYPQARVYFNIHWPGSTTTNGPASATSYGTNYNCASLPVPPLLAATLRCDDPTQPSGWEPAPLTMSTLTLDSVVMQAQSGGAWHTVRTYALGYSPDTAPGECWDDLNGQNYACAGEHVLTSVLQTPYQIVGGADTAMPSRQPITFSYSGPLGNEYHDTTKLVYNGTIFDAQTWWQYLTSYTDEQTGTGMSVTYKRAYGNTHGVPSGSDTDPFTCDAVSCSVPEDRQWPRQAVSQITDTATGAMTTYSYALNQACGSNCTQDTWIPPNGWNACGDSGEPPDPMPACLDSAWENYYQEEYTGFLQVYATQPDGSTDYTQYYAGNGWGTNDWDQANLARHAPQMEDVYQGAAGGTPLREVDHTYPATGNTCPGNVNGTQQLYNNPYMFCLLLESQTDTYQGGGGDTSTAPHETISRSYNPYYWYTMLDASALTANDLVADSATNYGGTQPTFTTNYSYTGRDGATESPATPFYFEELAQSETLNDNLGNRWTCQTTQYDGLGYLPSYDQSSIKYALPTQGNAYGDCGNSGNGYATSGEVSTGAGYDAFGQAIVSTDADALAGVSGHTGCTSGESILVAFPVGASNYTACTTYDSTQHAYAASSANALGQQSSATWDVVQGVPTSSTDPNNATTSDAGPVYEYSGTPSLATYQDTYAQETLAGETYGSPAWTTRVFTFSFCAGATTGGKPCLETDTVQQLDGTNLAVARQFYDRDGRLVETRSSGPTVGQDTVTYTVYDDVHAKVFQSLACSVPSLDTASGGRTVGSTPNYIAPTQTSSGSSAYVDPTTSNGSCTPALTGTTTYVDALGRAIASDDPMGTGTGSGGSGCVLPGGTTHHTTCTAYTAVLASTTSGLPSSDGEPYLQTLVIDANLHQSASYTDALGRTAYVQRFSGASQNPQGSGIASYSVTSYTYDGAGNLVSIVDPQGNTTTFGYNKLGEQTSLADPDRGNESYTYDANGNVTETVDARGASGTIYAGYDGLNRQLWRNSTNSSTGAYVTYSYDSTASGNDGVGRLTGESFNGGNGGTALGHGSYSYTYDARGQETKWVVMLSANADTLKYTYTDFGTPSSLTYPDNAVASYGYSGSGAPLSLTVTPSGGTATTLASTMLYSTATGTSGLLSSMSLAGGTYTYAPSYDGDLRVNDRRTTLTGSGAVLYDETLGFDAVGNVSSANTTLPGGTDNQAFCYDEQNRLTWAGSSGTPPCTGSAISTGTLSGPSLAYSDSLVYDSLDRTTSSSLMGGTFYDDPAHRHAATSTNGTNVSYAYDAAGNMTCRNVNSPSTTCAGSTPSGQLMSYDTEGRLTGWQNTPSSPTQTEQLAYDGEGRPVARQILYNGALYTSLYLGTLEEIASGSSGTTITQYYLLGGVPLAISTNGSIAYVTRDHLGSATVALDGSGSATASRLYDVRGVPRYFSPSGTMPGAEGYGGQHNGTYMSGLEAMGARNYEPYINQFASADTVLDGTAPPNRYAYVQDNPETYVDPSGHEPIPWWAPLVPLAPEIGIAILVGGGLALATNIHPAGESQAEIDQAKAKFAQSQSKLSGPDPLTVSRSHTYVVNNIGPDPRIPRSWTPTQAPDTGSGTKPHKPPHNAPQPQPGGAGSGQGGGGGSGQTSAGACEPTDGGAERPVNSRGDPYPRVYHPVTGQEMPFPAGDLSPTPPEARVEWNRAWRGWYISEWYERGLPNPPLPWAEYDIHHIQPREFGGTNDFENLWPVQRDIHQGPAPEGVTAWWNAYDPTCNE